MNKNQNFLPPRCPQDISENNLNEIKINLIFSICIYNNSKKSILATENN